MTPFWYQSARPSTCGRVGKASRLGGHVRTMSGRRPASRPYCSSTTSARATGSFSCAWPRRCCVYRTRRRRKRSHSCAGLYRATTAAVSGCSFAISRRANGGTPALTGWYDNARGSDTRSIAFAAERLKSKSTSWLPFSGRRASRRSMRGCRSTRAGSSRRDPSGPADSDRFPTARRVRSSGPALRQPTRLAQAPAQQEVDLCIQAAQIVVRPASQRRQDLRVEAQQERVALGQSAASGHSRRPRVFRYTASRY